MFTLNTQIKNLGTVVIPEIDFGDCKLQVFPFNNDSDVKLPALFSQWQNAFDAMRRQIPLVDGKNGHFVTIDSQYFASNGFLRREGIHIDGNFCADPTFDKPTWSDVPKPTWAGLHVEGTVDGWIVKSPWKLPYELIIPIGKYVSDDLGGILVAASKVGCRVWTGTITGDIGDSGNCEHLRPQLESSTNTKILGANECWFMTSNTPHETLETEAGTRRTLIRITLHHAYPNRVMLN